MNVLITTNKLGIAFSLDELTIEINTETIDSSSKENYRPSNFDKCFSQ